MRKICTLLMLLAASAGHSFGSEFNSIWRTVDQAAVPTSGERTIIPDRYLVYSASSKVLQTELSAVAEDPNQAPVFDLPMPDGHFRSFRIWQTPMMEKGLSDRFPEIYTFTATAIDNPSVSAKLDLTEWGFHAMVYDGTNTVIIDPYSNTSDGYYISFYKRDFTRSKAEGMSCGVVDENAAPADNKSQINLNSNGLPAIDWSALSRTNGATKKVFRLALACSGEYAKAVAGSNPTKSAVLAKMVTTMNRVNGVYERQLAVSMMLIANTDQLIYLDGTTDPYTNSSTSTMMGENITNVNSIIGAANFDIGHVFSTAGGGIAYLRAVCTGNKAGGTTGLTNPQGTVFDIDYVCHEMGHQFGADHTFNNSSGGCSGNGAASAAYEPGAGTTIMSYSGLCGDNFQNDSDPYYHSYSLSEMTAHITTGSGKSCGTASSAGNTPNTQPAFSGNYSIPFKTPFELTAPAATDANADSLLYGWEQCDLGDFGATWANTQANGPIFRTFYPTGNPTRVFPKMDKVLSGTLDYPGERAPQVARSMKFKLVTRDVYQGLGAFNFGNDSITINAVNTGTGFSVTSQNTAATNWMGGSTQTISWNVAGSNAAPINCSNVSIYMSVDGGYTWPYTIVSGTPNTGSVSVAVPNPANNSSQVRIKVKGDGNVFFNVNSTNFSVTHDNNVATTNPGNTGNPGNPGGGNTGGGNTGGGTGGGGNTGGGSGSTGIADVSLSDDANIYPVPANDVLHIVMTANTQPLNVVVSNTLGQTVWNGTMNKQVDIKVAGWAKGIYHVRLVDDAFGAFTTKSVVVQ